MEVTECVYEFVLRVLIEFPVQLCLVFSSSQRVGSYHYGQFSDRGNLCQISIEQWFMENRLRNTNLPHGVVFATTLGLFLSPDAKLVQIWFI